MLRWCADVERGRLRQVLAGPVRAGYRPAPSTGLLAQARARWRDPATWRDVAYLIGLWAPLFVLDTVVLSVWLTFLAGVTLPAWYWAPRGNAGLGYTSPTTIHGVALGYFPHGPHGPGGVGLYVDTLPTALLAAAGFLVLFLIFSYVLVLTARTHASVARSLLRAPADPLAPAKEVLAGPGPARPAARPPAARFRPSARSHTAVSPRPRVAARGRGPAKRPAAPGTTRMRGHDEPAAESSIAASQSGQPRPTRSPPARP